MKKQKIVIETNGTHKGTKLFVDGKQIYFESLSLVGDKNLDYDIIIGLTQSKATKSTIKKEVDNTDAVGFFIDNEEVYDE